MEHLAVHGYGDDVFIFALSTDKLRVWSVRKKALVTSLTLMAKSWENQEPAQSKIDISYFCVLLTVRVTSRTQGNEILV